jgi:hypothetical protein
MVSDTTKLYAIVIDGVGGFHLERNAISEIHS